MLKISFKKLILILSIILIIIIIVWLTYILYIKTDTKLPSDTPQFTQNTVETLDKFQNYFNNDQVQNALATINDNSRSENEKYIALKNLSFYFSTAYSASHEPKLRKYADNINKYAKSNFSNLYKASDFIIGCADPECGEKPDRALKEIHEEIINLEIEPEFLNTINKNFETAMYIPDDSKEGKEYGFGLVIQQLQIQNNPGASRAAKMLIKYVKEKYSYEYDFSQIK